MPTKILVFAGSLRKDSFNRKLAQANVSLAPEGVEVEHFLLDGLPNFNQDEEMSAPPLVNDLRQKIKEADGVIIVTPEYNFSFSSVTKSAIDWVSRPYGNGIWDNKPIAIQSASSGYMGGARAQYHLRQVLGFFAARQLYFPEVFVPFAVDKFNEKGELIDERITETIKKQLAAFVDLIRKGQ